MNKTTFVLLTILLSQPCFTQIPHLSADSDTANKSGNITIMKSTIYPADPNIGSWSVKQSHCSESLSEKLGWPCDMRISSIQYWGYRKKDVKNPGYYLLWFGPGPGQVLMENEEIQIEDKLKSVLIPELPSAAITKYILKYDDVFDDTLRDEYFGRIIIGEDYLAIGGWFDKFMAVGVYKNFENIDEFLSLANQYFQLPEIDREKIDISEADGLFYSYIDRENMFMLRGHRAFVTRSLETLNNMEKSDFKMVIELIKYYDEEFMP